MQQQMCHRVHLGGRAHGPERAVSGENKVAPGVCQQTKGCGDAAMSKRKAQATGGRREAPARAWPPGVSDLVWAPLVAGGIFLLSGLFGLLIGYVQLFPGLASTIYLQAASPEQPSARYYNVVVGHLIALVVAYLAVYAFGLAGEPAASALHALSPLRIYAATIAMALTVAGGLAARASHPPAATTAALITLGTVQATWQSAVIIMIDVLIIGGIGALLGQLRVYGALRSGKRG
jgi:hypothetical protein